MVLQQHIDNLEQRLEQLLSLTEGLFTENRDLRQHLQQAQAECTRLQQNNQAASQQIEAIISQLKQQFSDFDQGD